MIDKRLGFKQKLIDVLSHKTGIDLSVNHSDLVNRILSFYKLRNQLIHPKTHLKNRILPSHTEIFITIMSINMNSEFQNVIQFMNIIKPNFIKTRT